MRGSPLRNFACVLVLLAAMAIGVSLTTRQVDATSRKKSEIPASTEQRVKVQVRMLFSHPPEKVIVQQADKLENGTPSVNTQSTNNELDFSLNLPADQVTEFLIDVTWPEYQQAHYFTKITIRQDNKEDRSVIFSDSFTELSDTFSIDTRTHSASKP
jgi:hypothetical protein